MFQRVKTLKRNSSYAITFRDLLVGVKQEFKDNELALELLVEISRLSRMPTVRGDRYRSSFVSNIHSEWLADLRLSRYGADVFYFIGL